jgi:hypothetical protein
LGAGGDGMWVQEPIRVKMYSIGPDKIRGAGGPVRRGNGAERAIFKPP